MWQLNEKTALRGGWGTVLRHAAPLLQHALRQQPAVGRADHAHQPGGRLRQSVSDLSGRQSVPGAGDRTGRTRRSRRPASTSTRRSTRKPTSLQQWNVGAQRQVGDWLLTGSYLGNHSSHLWRATELNYAVYSPGATTATTNARRRLVLQEPGAGRVLRHARPARRHRPGELQRHAAVGAAPAEGRPQHAGQLHAVEVHERSGDDRDHRADHHRSDQPGSRLLVLRLGSPPRRQRVASSGRRRRSRHAAMRAVFSDWQIAPLVRWQSGSRFIGHDRRRQRAVGRRAASARVQVVGRRRTATAAVNNYLNLAAFTSPAPGTYSTLKPNAFVGPVAAAERPRRQPELPARRARVPVPLGDLQRAEHGELQQPDGRAQQHELRAHPDGSGSAYHAVRVQVRFNPEGLRPWTPARALGRRFAGALRARGCRSRATAMAGVETRSSAAGARDETTSPGFSLRRSVRRSALAEQAAPPTAARAAAAAAKPIRRRDEGAGRDAAAAPVARRRGNACSPGPTPERPGAARIGRPRARAIIERLGYESGMWDTFIRTDSNIIADGARRRRTGRRRAAARA